MPLHISTLRELTRRVVAGLIANPWRLLAAFCLLLGMAGVMIFAVASHGFHELVDRATLEQQRTLAAHAAQHVAMSPAFERDPVVGSRLRSPADRPLLQREMELHMRTFGVERIAFFDRNLHPLATAPVYSESIVRDEIVALRALLANPDLSFSQELDPESATLRYRASVRIDERIVGYVAMQINTSVAHRIAHSAFSDAQAHLAWAVMLGLGLLLAPMYLSVLGNTAEHRALVKANTKLHELATTDSLTRVYNRNSLNLAVEREFQRLRRQVYRRASLCVAMVDIDHFKRINDTYGHTSGDAVLAAVASRLKLAVRGYDLIGRYGGEEFLLMLPNTDADGAAIVGERIRHFVSATPIMVGQAVVNVTVSVGIALVTDATTRDLDAINCADAALYRAKAGGRNRVEIDMVATPHARSCPVVPHAFPETV